jgi:hypothetical protein
MEAPDAATVPDAAGVEAAADWLALAPGLPGALVLAALPEAPLAAAAPDAAPPGKGGADIPWPASDAKIIGSLRNGFCGWRTVSTFVSFFACA